jgi:DNA-directed RNA polymerase subunit beta'
LKESVIIGKLIPAGTGFRAQREKEEAEAEELQLESLEAELLRDLADEFLGPDPLAEIASLDALLGEQSARSEDAEDGDQEEEEEQLVTDVEPEE